MMIDDDRRWMITLENIGIENGSEEGVGGGYF
jgi:hypothetical protein